MHTKSAKLKHVCYDIRGPVIVEAARMEAAGEQILKLNIGNPAPFGFTAPKALLDAIGANLHSSQGYCDAKGLPPARELISNHYQAMGVNRTSIDHIFIGNGVSELIQMSLQALVDNGDEILLPAPDYPLWTACTVLAGGNAVHYRCDESNGWQPDLDDIRAKITPRTKGLVVINPNNPTGAVYSKEMLLALVDIAREHKLVLFADEIYDQILYDDAVHHPMAALSDDVLTLTFNGLSKAYLAAGFRQGWLMVSGDTSKARDYLEGLNMLANMRLCANVPSQHALLAALGDPASIKPLLLPTGRLCQQRDLAFDLLSQIEGVSCVKPKGGLYLFPRLDPKRFAINNDESLVLDLLRKERILLVQGTGFHYPSPDHVRIVFLPPPEVLSDAITRFGHYLDGLAESVKTSAA
ncbi:MAG: pyridoxal phosphate-dependent aminotransferase [Pseudomonadota bacterium]|uniref:alanine transaminase n=1 Tax=Gallaecimonas pentaromativorans TaxID=584787 RepID=A0A3N1PMA1_9GAMM|nr:pyridoxal phosphate-dependent aminotransferase [Gallaecimonas pentaromativorans]MED5525984.1 pyridoxal phosphate-dependent aminotransferase [Pseudomonadota bacterium]ROQ29703.1 alanine-synthesizing transaminase [Gallaecimonas pentaromativorans]